MSSRHSSVEVESAGRRVELPRPGSGSWRLDRRNTGAPHAAASFPAARSVRIQTGFRQGGGVRLPCSNGAKGGEAH
jgi:hypothetical protein